MISDVVIIGTLEDKINSKYRYIKAYSSDSMKEEEIPFMIPLLFWTRSNNNIMLNRPNGSLVAIRGRIESNEEIGLYILVETMNSFVG